MEIKYDIASAPMPQFSSPQRNLKVEDRGVAASRFVGRQDLVAYKGLVLTLGSMITIPMVWSM